MVSSANQAPAPAPSHIPAPCCGPAPVAGVAVGLRGRFLLLVGGRDAPSGAGLGVAVLDTQAWAWSRPAQVAAADGAGARAGGRAEGPSARVGAAVAALPPPPPALLPSPARGGLAARWAAHQAARNQAQQPPEGLVLVGGLELDGGGGVGPPGEAWVAEVGWA